MHKTFNGKTITGKTRVCVRDTRDLKKVRDHEKKGNKVYLMKCKECKK